MIYNSTKMYIDIYNKHPHYDEYFYTELEMPGSDIDIKVWLAGRSVQDEFKL